MGNDMCFCHRRKYIDKHKDIIPYEPNVNMKYELSEDLTQVIDHKTKIYLEEEYQNYHLKRHN